MAIYNGNQLIVPSGISKVYNGNSLVYQSCPNYRNSLKISSLNHQSFSFYFSKYSTPDAPSVNPEFYYSIDNGEIWTAFTLNDIINVSDSVLIRNANQQFSCAVNNAYYFFQIHIGGQVKLSGKINSLTNFNDVNQYGVQCYMALFEGNYSSIIDASELVLPSTPLGEWSYQSMFSGCDSLTKPPVLTFSGFINNTFSQLNSMFRDCYALEEIKLLNYTGGFTNNMYSFSNWVDGVPQTGDFYYNGWDTQTFGPSAIPTGWTVHNF